MGSSKSLIWIGACRACIFMCLATAAASRLRAQILSSPWVELGDGDQTIARIVVTSAHDCPSLLADGRSLAMAPRLPAPASLRVACQATIPPGTASASINGKALPLPTRNPKRIVVIGDTGCRIKDKRVQDCNDINQWPFRQIAGDAAQERPDLVIHVGDFVYRESPCPPGAEKECGGTPTGDTWDAWNADFFTPAAKLLAAAPWAIARGNHESCERSWRGWFYYLDPRDWDGRCDPFSKPYVIHLGAFELAMFDSSESTDEQLDAHEASIYAGQLSSLHLENAWLVTHIPFWGFKAGQDSGPPVALSASLEEAWNKSAPKGVSLIVSGHVHLFEFVTLNSGRPPQLVAGDGGTLMAAPIDSPAAGTVVRGASVTGSESQHKWGYTLLVREKDSWTLTLENHQHEALVSCDVLGASSTCKASEPQ